MEDKQAKEVGIAKVIQSLVAWFLEQTGNNTSESGSKENEKESTEITSTNQDTTWIFSTVFRASEIFIYNEDVQFGSIFSTRKY